MNGKNELNEEKIEEIRKSKKSFWRSVLIGFGLLVGLVVLLSSNEKQTTDQEFAAVLISYGTLWSLFIYYFSAKVQAQVHGWPLSLLHHGAWIVALNVFPSLRISGWIAPMMAFILTNQEIKKYNARLLETSQVPPPLPKNRPQPPSKIQEDTEAEREIYDVVAQEIERNELKRDLWTKAFAENDGDDAKTKAAYIRERVAELNDARTTTDTRMDRAVSENVEPPPLPRQTQSTSRKSRSLPHHGPSPSSNPLVKVIGSFCRIVGILFLSIILLLIVILMIGVFQDIDRGTENQNTQSAPNFATAQKTSPPEPVSLRKSAKLSEDKTKSPSPAAHPRLSTDRPIAAFSIVSSNILLHHKRSLDVRLQRKLPIEDLITLAHYLKVRDPKKYNRTFISFYLPGMQVGAGSWASGHFNPNFELKHQGLSFEDEQALRAQPSLAKGEERIGSWLEENWMIPSSRTEFIKNGNNYQMRKTYSDGSIGTNALSRRWTFGGYRYFKEGKTGSRDDYFRITKNNGLEIWSFDPLKGKRILTSSLKPMVTSSPVPASPETKQSPRKPETPMPTQNSRTNASEAWYSGGTLHKAKMREWSRSSYPNRLATSSDFTAKLLELDGKKIPPVDRLKPLAMLLEHNISTANSGGVADDQDVSEVASACWVLMNKQQK